MQKHKHHSVLENSVHMYVQRRDPGNMTGFIV